MKLIKKFGLSVFLFLTIIFTVNLNVAEAANITVYKKTNYSAVYNFDFYISKYPDLAKTYSKNPKGALIHFVNNGMKEGRVASPDFDIEVYRNNNPDLLSAFKGDNVQYYRHYIFLGKNEGRVATSGNAGVLNINPGTAVSKPVDNVVSVYKGIDYSKVYDYDYYINTYEDVLATCGSDRTKVLEHFVNTGIPLRRKGNATFDVVIYMKYPDLRAAFGENSREYYLHYITTGYAEDRIGNNIKTTTDTISMEGITKPYEICFIADTHVALCDKRDEEILVNSYRRYENFMDINGKYSDQVFSDLMDTAVGLRPDIMILGGDIVDAATYASIEFVSDKVKNTGLNYAYLTGNHDFEYGNNYYNYAAYNTYLPRLNGLKTTRDGYQVIDCGEFTIFLADDDNYKFTESAVAALEQEIKKGKPIMFFTHVPIEPVFDHELLYTANRLWGEGALLGESRGNLDPTAKKMTDLILSASSPVFAVYAGHLHFYHKDVLNGRITQVVTGPGYEGGLLRIRVTG